MYRHTQVGILTTAVIVLAAVLTAAVLGSALGSAEGQDAIILTVTGIVVTAVFAAGLVSFCAFTIQVADERLGFWFGPGVSRRELALGEIRSVEVVKNPWYFFWGIKSIPGGWLYGIAPGGRAVEITLRDGNRIRLGTNRPEEAKRMVDRAIGIAG